MDPEQGISQEVRKQRTATLLERVRAATGDERAALLDQVVQLNSGVARTVAEKYAPPGVPPADLDRAVRDGLVRAAQRFDLGPDEDFLGRAASEVHAALKRCLREHGWAGSSR